MSVAALCPFLQATPHSLVKLPLPIIPTDVRKRNREAHQKA